MGLTLDTLTILALSLSTPLADAAGGKGEREAAQCSIC